MVSQTNLRHFKHSVAVPDLSDFMGVSVFSVAFSSNCAVAEGTMATLERLDTFVATINCLRGDGSEKVGDIRQKLYRETFLAFLPITFAQLIQQIRVCVKDCCPEDPTVSSLPILAVLYPASRPIQLSPTMQVHISFLDKNLIGLSSQWFSEYITSYMDTNHDCYIVKINTTERKLVPFGAYSNSTDMYVDL